MTDMKESRIFIERHWKLYLYKNEVKLKVLPHFKMCDDIKKDLREKNIVDDEYVYIRKNAFYNHIKDTKESQKIKNATFVTVQTR